MAKVFSFNRGLDSQLDLETLMSLMTQEDILVFIEDGVNWVLKSHSMLSTVPNCYFLEQDLVLRGLSDSKESIKAINYNELVELFVRHKMVAW